MADKKPWVLLRWGNLALVYFISQDAGRVLYDITGYGPEPERRVKPRSLGKVTATDDETVWDNSAARAQSTVRMVPAHADGAIADGTGTDVRPIVISALIALGYGKRDAQDTVSKLDRSLGQDEMLRAALASLGP